MRLIDADALKNAFSNMYREDYERWIKEVIDNAPTVDTTFREVVAYECGQKSVEERPSRGWIHDPLHNPVCSVCGGIRRDNRFDHINFCNKCGADMRGDEK